MVNWQKLTKFIDFGVILYRLFVEPLGLFKVNKEKKDLEEPTEPAPSPSKIKIDARIIEAEIDPLIYGSFIEVLAKCIYGGIWDEYNKNVTLIHGGLRQDVIEEVRALEVTIIRWPGGCFSDVYHWENGIGTNEQRKKEKNKHWHWYGPKIGPKHDNHFGSDEFMLFLKEVGAEPYININYGSGTPAEAAQWVEYMNGDESTEFGAFRAQNGHPEPYNVKYWGIGNEIFGTWEEGHSTPENYARRYLEFARVMRAVDPTIKLIAVGADFDFSHWNRPVLEIAGDEIDYLSHHVYIPGKAVATISNTKKDFYTIIAGAFEMERRIQWVENSITEVIGDKKKIPIAFDEWNAMWNVRQHYQGYYTLRDGIFAASVFEVIHRHADAIKIANFAQLVNVIPMIVTSETDVYHNPIYLAFQLFSTHAEQNLVSFSVTCDSCPIPTYGNIKYTEVPYLGCSITTNKAKDRLVIIGINRHHAHDLPTMISLSNFEPELTAQIFELNGKTHSAYNSFDKKDEVKITKKEFSPVGNQFTYTFPAHSVTTLILHKKI
ncbi:MAG: alpha-N-arabinofuranosidase [Promethearchaeota archaeon]